MRVRDLTPVKEDYIWFAGPLKGDEDPADDSPTDDEDDEETEDFEDGDNDEEDGEDE